jgi:hypothetical protein
MTMDHLALGLIAANVLLAAAGVTLRCTKRYGIAIFVIALTSCSLAISTTPSTSSGTIYYVSNSGDDANSGTPTSSPWRTIGKVQSYLRNLKPGDSVLFQRGGIWYELLDIDNVNGSSTARITFGNYGSGNLPIIDGGGTLSGFTVNNGRQWCIGGSGSKMSYITIDGFECRFTSSYGIIFDGVAVGSVGNIVQNSYIHDTGNGDFGYHNQLYFSGDGHAYGTKFLNNKVGNCYGHNCIQIHGDTGSPVIQGNECYRWSHNCIDVKNVQGALVDSNVVHDGLGIETYSEAYYIENSGTTYTNDVTWTHNVVYGNFPGPTQYTAFQCQDGTPGGPVMCHAYNNTVYGNIQSFYGGSDSGTISNVSIYVENNIFYNPVGRSGGGYVVWDYNDNVQTSPIGPHDLRVDPQFVNASSQNFHLQSTSPVIDKGTNVGLPYNGSAPDIGVFEYVVGSPRQEQGLAAKSAFR